MPNGKPFTYSEIGLLHDKSLSNTDISKITGRNPILICNKRAEYEITKYKRDTVKYTDDDIKLLEDRSISDSELGKILGRTGNAIHNKRRKMGLFN